MANVLQTIQDSVCATTNNVGRSLPESMEQLVQHTAEVLKLGCYNSVKGGNATTQSPRLSYCQGCKKLTFTCQKNSILPEEGFCVQDSFCTISCSFQPGDDICWLGVSIQTGWNRVTINNHDF